MKKSATVIYLVCTAPIHLGVHIYEKICITERDVELQKEKCQKLTIAKGRQLRKYEQELFVLCGTPIHLGLHPYKVLSKYT